MADELDRLYRTLVDVLRESRGPQWLAPFSVGELYRDLVPYPRVRTPLGFWSHGDYEITLLRLLAGERGYVLPDVDDVRDACARELAEAVPDRAVYRNYDSARVRVNPRTAPDPKERPGDPSGSSFRPR
jgi:hypothetical protein